MQDILREMQATLIKTSKQAQISNMIQNLIYFFNQQSIRDYIITFHANIIPDGKKIKWDGTYFFDESGNMDIYHHADMKKQMVLADFLRNRPSYHDKDCRFVLSSCCITYEGLKVHFLSIIYDTKKKFLVFFDPGIHLYEKGQDLAVPIVKDAFVKNGWISNVNMERVGLCSANYHGKKWGIQYDGNDPKITKLPADSFCQSWTIYYLVEFLRNKCTDTFFSNWCSVPPEKREAFIMMNFFLPHIQNNPFLYKEWKQFYPHGDTTQLNQYAINVFSKK